MLAGSFLVGSASASAFQARFAAIDLVPESHRAKQLSYVVWGSTVGAVTGPNLMAPAGNLAEHFGLPRLTGPYMISATTLTFASLLIFLFLVVFFQKQVWKIFYGPPHLIFGKNVM